MSEFTIHTLETAPVEAQGTLAKAQEKYGMIPNLLGVMAEAPATLEAYLALGELEQKTSFSAVEQHVIYLTISAVNGCHYCMAAHSTVALNAQVPQDVVQALRNNQPIADARLEQLRQFVKAIVDKQGWVTGHDLSALFEYGYDRRQALEAVLFVAHKTISNYINHFASTPVDKPFQAQEWQPGRLAQ